MIYFSFEKDNLEQTLKRAILNKDITQKEHKGQGLWVSLKLLHGDLKQVSCYTNELSMRLFISVEN